MISNGEKREPKSEGRQLWYYLVVKMLSALLKGITPKHHGDFYFLNCLHFFATEKNFNHIRQGRKSS